MEVSQWTVCWAMAPEWSTSAPERVSNSRRAMIILDVLPKKALVKGWNATFLVSESGLDQVA
jgi:hypothetical protein